MHARTIEVTDDSGFLALVDPDAYLGFIDRDWTLDQLFERFHAEMAARRLLIWGTGVPSTWQVEVRGPAGTRLGYRQLLGSIVSTRGRLLLTNYESLSMAAQFADIVLPQPFEASQLVEVVPGRYRCRITQLQDPAALGAPRDGADFIVELEAARELEEVWREIP